MFGIHTISRPENHHDELRRWRRGRIVMQSGQLLRIEKRLWTGSVSMAQVWWQSRHGRPDDEFCWLDYHQPWGMPGFLTLDYIRSGSRAGYRSFVGACHVLDDIARIRGSVAIVAHVSTSAISDRLLARMGWEQHLQHWSGRHWIRRFYDGYPDSQSQRYVV